MNKIKFLKEQIDSLSEKEIKKLLYLLEGGWVSVKTQDVKLTPLLVKEAVLYLKRFEEEVNSFFEEEKLPPIQIIRPVGSGSWYEEDIEKEPDKTYGDIDVVVEYPTLDLGGNTKEKKENLSVKLYNEKMKEWISKQNPSYIDIEETLKTKDAFKPIFVFSFEEKEVIVQVDFIYTHRDYLDWTLFRYTPVRGIKGFVVGNLYTTLGETLGVSLNQKGVVVKISNNQIVNYKSRSSRTKEIMMNTITINSSSFFLDITRFFWERSTKKAFNPSSLLKQYPGVGDINNYNIEDVCNGIRGVASTLEQLGTFGEIEQFRSASSFLERVVELYEKRMNETVQGSKFEKATTEQAFQSIEKIKKIVEEYKKKVKELLLK